MCPICHDCRRVYYVATRWYSQSQFSILNSQEMVSRFGNCLPNRANLDTHSSWDVCLTSREMGLLLLEDISGGRPSLALGSTTIYKDRKYAHVGFTILPIYIVIHVLYIGYFRASECAKRLQGQISAIKGGSIWHVYLYPLIIILLSVSLIYSHPRNRPLTMSRPTEQEVNDLAGLYEAASWFHHNTFEPLIGDQDCPHQAERFGIPRRSCYTVFVECRAGRVFGCRFERCRGYSSRLLEEAVAHQRQHHFNHRPFVCPVLGASPW